MKHIALLLCIFFSPFCLANDTLGSNTIKVAFAGYHFTVPPGVIGIGATSPLQLKFDNDRQLFAIDSQYAEYDTYSIPMHDFVKAIYGPEQTENKALVVIRKELMQGASNSKKLMQGSLTIYYSDFDGKSTAQIVDPKNQNHWLTLEGRGIDLLNIIKHLTLANME